MNLPQLTALITAIAVSLSASPTGLAKNPPKAKVAAKAPAKKPNPPARSANGKNNGKKNGKKKGKGGGKPEEVHHTVIASVDLDSITVKEDKTTKDYKVTKDTIIELRGQKASLFDLKEGMRVSITIGFDPTTLDRIIANDAPPKAAAGKNTGKKKKPTPSTPKSESASGLSTSGL